MEGEMDDFPLIEIKKTKIQRRCMSGPSSQTEGHSSQAIMLATKNLCPKRRDINS